MAHIIECVVLGRIASVFSPLAFFKVPLNSMGRGGGYPPPLATPLLQLININLLIYIKDDVVRAMAAAAWTILKRPTCLSKYQSSVSLAFILLCYKKYGSIAQADLVFRE